MSAEIRVPTLGESIVDATVASWLKSEGDAVQRGEALVELETDKVNVEVNAEQDGVLQKIIKQSGDVVAVGDVLGLLGEASAQADHGQQQESAVRTQEQNHASSESALATPSSMLRPPSPLARRIAAEHNVDIAQVQGSSPHGRVTKEDVINYLAQGRQNSPSQPLPAIEQASGRSAAPTQAPAAPPPPLAIGPQRGREERVRLSRRRQTIAQRLVEAQHTAAMLTTFNEIDMSAVMEVRSRRKEAFKERHNISLGFMSFFTKAVVGALKAFPRLNAEIQGNEMILKHYYDIGIAVGAEEGLVVPVLRDADRKSFAEIEREIADLAKRVREGSVSLAELQGGTFTITNGGVFGSLLSTPILNAPQVGILGMHKIEQRPIALNGQVVIRPMMYVALSYDHRIVDGREAVQFLVRVKELVEDPETLLLEG
ncbi:2-oxoglutarate dehydrogenase complex dihydrolipoyllysine-residue succinyltransferase [Ktedonosporobacter rubrisoli]|uniref:Dihydrolipoyllysine-residue succinyltransferase component of 2-oxoglutarate dehydrogenase complex n=1 Tax=Ktedonosporobacter rubrisoli TaxID=2509675 RepID=A0A4P6K5B6_KTERU|nr:2-oxoglutarate dehydrogenase complex dihydrolipoyllysine-residue succinyltransferase [Ktedonosporobacter rubrisoli]QBD83182.1 2-oxoglutarate dehydrogenase complex dihydrolipoyllysine-residue succinyltransferase [Ktedonosporobacter rubrisoli]